MKSLGINPSTQHNDFLQIIKDPWYKIILQIEQEIVKQTHLFYSEKEIVNIAVPVLTPTICCPIGLGSDSMPVRVKIGSSFTYLTDSAQFFLEYGCRFFPTGCFSISPSFRSELVDNTHLFEFQHSEAEIQGGFLDAIELAEEYLRYLSLSLLNRFSDVILEIAGSTKHIENFCSSKKSVPKITFEEATKTIHNLDFITNKEYGFRYLTKLGQQQIIKEFEGFVWVTHFDHLSIPFFQAFDNDNNQFSLTADLLFGLGEGLGLGERHETASQLSRAIQSHGIKVKDYEWYIKLREQFPLKTSGFGLGIERYICWLLKHNNVRDCTLFSQSNDINFIPRL